MFSDPKQILSQIALPQGAVVCDIGAGSGFYTMSLSTLVGDNGRVYALDIQKELLNKVASEARAQHRYNVEVVWGDAEKLGGTKLREGLCDMAVVANILFQIEKKDVFIDEIKRILKPKGKILIVDWSDSFGNMGPHADHVVTKDAAEALGKKHGLTLERTVEAGAHHYGMIMAKP